MLSIFVEQFSAMFCSDIEYCFLPNTIPYKYSLYKILSMLYSARNHPPVPYHPSPSNSNTKVPQPKNKILTTSSSQLKLRQAINCKYERSKIKFYQYSNFTTSMSKKKNKIADDESQHSFNMEQYANLLGQKFINLKQYHSDLVIEQPQKKYLIRLRFSQNKKPLKQDPSLNSRQRIFVKNKDMEPKQEYSGGKNKQLPKNYSPKVKITSQEKQSSSHQEQKSRLYFLRKQKKSPNHQDQF